MRRIASLTAVVLAAAGLTATMPVGAAQAAPGSTTPPALLQTSPGDQTTSGAVIRLSATWDETLWNTYFTVLDHLGEQVAGVSSISGRRSVFTMDSTPAEGTYTAKVTAFDTDLDVATKTWSFTVAAPPTVGTPVCGTLPTGTTTWSAADAPYLICPDGVTLPEDGTLELDAAGGGFHVLATGSGGLTARGRVTSAHPDPSRVVTFDAVGQPTAGQWSGISNALINDYPQTPTTVLALTDVAVRHAVVGVRMRGRYVLDSGYYTGVSLTRVAVSDAQEQGILAEGAATALHTVSTTSTGEQGIRLACIATTDDSYGSDPVPALVDGAQVTSAWQVGIEVTHCDGATIRGNTVRASGLHEGHPAISLHAPQSEVGGKAAGLGLGTLLTGNTGGGNGLDAILVFGLQVGGFTWISPTKGDDDHVLGYLNAGLTATGTGTVVIPANAVVKGGYLAVNGPSLTSATGAVFTSFTDDTAGMPTCASVLATSCTPQSGDWRGLGGTSAISLTGTTIRYAWTGVTTQNPGSAGRTGKLLTLTGVTIHDCWQGLYSGDVSITESTIRDIGFNHAVSTSGYAVVATGSVRVRGLTASRLFAGALHAAPFGVTPGTAPPETFDAVGVAVDQAAEAVAISSWGGVSPPYDDPVLKDLTVTDTAVVGSLGGTHLSIGPGRSVDRLQGARNTSEALTLEGELSGGLAWVTARPSSALHPVGYRIGALTVQGGTLSVPVGSDVPVCSLTLVGATLSVAAGTTLHGLEPANPQVGTRYGSSLVMQPTAGGAASKLLLDGVVWDDLGDELHDNPYVGAVQSTDPNATIRITNSQLSGAPFGNDFVPGAPMFYAAGPVTLRHDALRGMQLVLATGSLTDSVVVGGADPGSPAGGIGIQGATFTLTNDVISNVQHGMSVYGGTVTMTGTRVTSTGWPFNDDPTTRAAVRVAAGSRLLGSCNSIRENRFAGLAVAGDGMAVITDSDLYGSGTNENGYDVYSGGGSIDARRSWWGHSDGPHSGQVQGSGASHVDSTTPATTQRPASSLGLAGSSRRANGTFGPGTLSATLTFNRRMGTTLQPMVTLTGADGTRHVIKGAWKDTRTWLGSYAVTPQSAVGGPNRVEASSARGCVNDPSTNLMTPVGRTITMAGPSATLTVASPTTLASSVPVTWTSSTAGAAVKDVDLGYQRAGADGPFSPFAVPSGWSHRTTAPTLTMQAGFTYCIRIRARDAAGTITAWSAPRCVAAPIDDRPLGTSSGWTRITAAGSWHSTVTRSSHQGSYVRSPVITLGRVGVIVTKCRTCGTVTVLVAGRVIGNVSLRADSVKRRVVVMLPSFRSTQGSVEVRITSAGKPVEIDGLVLSAL